MVRFLLLALGGNNWNIYEVKWVKINRENCIFLCLNKSRVFMIISHQHSCLMLYFHSFVRSFVHSCFLFLALSFSVDLLFLSLFQVWRLHRIHSNQFCMHLTCNNRVNKPFWNMSQSNPYIIWCLPLLHWQFYSIHRIKSTEKMPLSMMKKIRIETRIISMK